MPTMQRGIAGGFDTTAGDGDRHRDAHAVPGIIQKE